MTKYKRSNYKGGFRFLGTNRAFKGIKRKERLGVKQLLKCPHGSLGYHSLQEHK